MSTDRTLHLSLDLELSEGVRLLALQLRLREPMLAMHADGWGMVAINAEALAALLGMRLFVDWGRQRSGWRALHTASAEWSSEPVAMLMEQSCGWCGHPGALIEACVAARLLRVEEREGVRGLVFPAFESDNAHLLPGYRSMHQKGGDAKALRRRMREVEGAVHQTQELLQAGGIALFAEAGISEEDQKAALSLVMRIDSACGRSLRNPSEYRGEQELMKAALHRARRHTPSEIESVLRYLMTHSRNPAVSKDTAIILRDFDTTLRFAGPTSSL